MSRLANIDRCIIICSFCTSIGVLKGSGEATFSVGTSMGQADTVRTLVGWA